MLHITLPLTLLFCQKTNQLVHEIHLYQSGRFHRSSFFILPQYYCSWNISKGSSFLIWQIVQSVQSMITSTHKVALLFLQVSNQSCKAITIKVLCILPFIMKQQKSTVAQSLQRRVIIKTQDQTFSLVYETGHLKNHHHYRNLHDMSE